MDVMSSSQGLLNAIIAQPDDDAPRLVYADWLEENGSTARAEFIRIQCEMAKRELWEEEFSQLERQSEKLLEKHEEAWKKEIGVKKAHLYYRRGTIEQLTLSAKALFELDPEVLKSTPIKRVRITHANDEKLIKLRDSGVLKLLPGLRLNNASVPHMLETLKACSNKLRQLDFSGYAGEFDGEFGATIAECSFSKRLTSLTLRACSVLPDFFEALAQGGGLPKLERLELGGGMVIALPSHFENMNLKRVSHLRIGGKLRVKDVEELCHISTKKLKTVYMKGTRPPAAGLKRLIEAGAFKNAERIGLSNCNLSKASLAMLLDSKFPKCTHLNLTNNQHVDRNFVDRLASGKSFPKLKAVNVSETSLDGVSKSKFKDLRFNVTT